MWHHAAREPLEYFSAIGCKLAAPLLVTYGWRWGIWDFINGGAVIAQDITCPKFRIISSIELQFTKVRYGIIGCDKV